MSNEKEYDVAVWQLTYCKIDTETGDYLCDDDGKVIEFYIPDEECSFIAESVDIDELVEVKMSKKQSVGASVTLFIEEVFEIAFGAEAIDRDFTLDEVLEKLREFSDAALSVTPRSNLDGLTQEEVDTLLSNKSGGMFND